MKMNLLLLHAEINVFHFRVQMIIQTLPKLKISKLIGILEDYVLLKMVYYVLEVVIQKDFI